MKSYIEYLTYNIEELQSQKMKVNSKLLKDLRIWPKYGPSFLLHRLGILNDVRNFF